MQISIILDQRDNEAITKWAAQGPIWLRQSPAYQQIVKELRGNGQFAEDQITTFTAPDHITAEEAAHHILDTVIQHHPAWTTLVFVGLRNGTAIYAALHPDYPCKLTELADCIILER